jgi:hypothetical protein
LLSRLLAAEAAETAAIVLPSVVPVTISTKDRPIVRRRSDRVAFDVPRPAVSKREMGMCAPDTRRASFIAIAIEKVSAWLGADGAAFKLA